MMPDPHEQRRFAVEVVGRLRDAGHVAFWAGGCVRDELLGRTPKDYDVATSARPEQTRELFGRRRTLAVGEAFGVIVVIGTKATGTVEVTTFRRDATYSDGRRPDAVHFTDAEEDARRRDFTINALFFDPLNDRVLDYVDGQSDLRRGLIRAVGDPAQRFQEDKLRMLRAVRMAARFGFEIDPATFAAVQASAADIHIVSPERIAQEFRGMFGLPGQATAADLLMSTGLAAAIVPELTRSATGAASDDVATRWSRTLAVLETLERRRVASFAVALAALLHEVGAGPNVAPRAACAAAAETAIAVARRLRLSNDEREHAAWLLGRRCELADAARRPWSDVQPLLAHRWGPDLVTFEEAVVEARHGVDDDLEFARDKLALPRHLLDPQPLVDGNDLRRLTIPPGPEFARLLQAVRRAQLDGQVVDHAGAVEWVRRLHSGDSA